MQTQPLSELIRNRGFDRYQGGLDSRFRAYKFEYQLTYGEPSDNSAMYVDFAYQNQQGRMTVWESGECDLEVLDSQTGQNILCKHYELKEERDFHLLLANFALYFRDGKNLPE